MAAKRILAVGAGGTFAGMVVPELKLRGAWVRGLTHDARAAERIRAVGADEVVVADLSDRDDLARALNGVDATFYISPVGIADEATVGQAFVDVARQAGVRRIVFSSVIHPVLADLANHRNKLPVEDAILGSGLEYTLLHPAVFFQNLDGAMETVTRTGVLAEPWSNDTRFSRVDYRDVAEVAAIALTEDRLLNGTFELCADGWLNRHDVATLMGKALGRHVEAQRTDPEAAARQMPFLREMFTWYDQHGLLGNHLTLGAILGREPRTLKAYLTELAGRA